MKETMKKLSQNIFDNINNINKLSKFYLNQTSITTKRKKNLIQEANKFLGVSKFRINVLQLERVI